VLQKSTGQKRIVSHMNGTQPWRLRLIGASLAAGMGGLNQQRGGPGGGAPGGGGGGPPPAPKELREGDWQCPGCGNTNFAFR